MRCVGTKLDTLRRPDLFWEHVRVHTTYLKSKLGGGPEGDIFCHTWIVKIAEKGKISDEILFHRLKHT